MLKFAPKLQLKNPICSAGTDIKICETGLSEVFSDAATPWLASVVLKLPFDYFGEISYLRLLNDLPCRCCCIWSGKTKEYFWAKKSFPESIWTLNKPVSLTLFNCRGSCGEAVCFKKQHTEQMGKNRCSSCTVPCLVRVQTEVCLTWAKECSNSGKDKEFKSFSLLWKNFQNISQESFQCIYGVCKVIDFSTFHQTFQFIWPVPVCLVQSSERWPIVLFCLYFVAV